VLSSLSVSNGFRVIGNTADDLYVISVSGAGDVNGDGIDDLVIGAPYAKTDGGKTGAAYVIFGNASGFSASVSLSSLNGKNGFQISGENGWDRVGWSVSAAGDVNGDGIGDIIIGAWGASLGGKEAGGAYVVFGKAGGFGGNLNLSALNGKNGFQINGESPGDRAGWSVSAAGDINGDGYGDLIVGGPQDVGVDGAGAAWVLFGKAEDFDSSIDLSELDGNNGFRIGGEDEFDAAGTSVSAAGDINGDGFDDLIVGADLAGTAYIIYGKQTAPTSGADTLTGASGNETITGLGGDDLLSGMTGNDSLAGNADDDRLEGGSGKDLLDGGSGADRLTGGKGDDTYVTDGADKIIEKSNEGTDTVRSSASVTLGANVEHLVLTGSGAINGTGNSAANSLTGNSGANSLNGGGGSDTLAGGKASDILTGGGGSDTFVFDTKPGSSNIDSITDYNVAADTMRIDNAVFSGLANGGLKASAFVKNTSGNAADASDRIIYESDTGKLYFDRDGTGSAAKVYFATLEKNLALTHADFIVF
jgi:Ca2+-binding RTX toxin-like protein